MAATEVARSQEPHDQTTDGGVLDATTQFDDLRGFIGFKLRIAQECVFRGFADAVDNPDLRPRVFAALCVIAQFPGISQSDLGFHVGRDKSTITPMIADLIAGGQVRREQDAADRRSFHLFLTPVGRALLDRQWAAAHAHEARIDAAVGGPEAKAAFIEQLDRLIHEFG